MEKIGSFQLLQFEIQCGSEIAPMELLKLALFIACGLWQFTSLLSWRRKNI